MNCENQGNCKPKSRFVFILLALFFNIIGLHWFYIGRAGLGAINLFYSTVIVVVFLLFDAHYSLFIAPLLFLVHWLFTLIMIAFVDRDVNSVKLQ